MNEVMQDSLHRYVDISKYSTFRVARVTAIYDDGTFDLAFFDGNIAAAVPTLASLNGTNFGKVETAAPTPEPTNTFGATATFNPQQSGNPNVDIYAVVGCFDGVRVSRSYFILGFIQPAISAMKFDPALINNAKELFVYRHPADVQVTIDDNGCTEIQHPCGTRIAIGDVSKIMGTNILQNKVDLTDKDINHQFYKLTQNTGRKAGIVVTDSAGDTITVDGNNTITIKDVAGDTVTLSQGTITIQDQVGDSVTLSNSTITVQDVAKDSVTIADGTIVVSAPTVNILGSGAVTVNGGAVTVNSAADIAFTTSVFATTLNQILTTYNLHTHPGVTVGKGVTEIGRAHV